jgi:AcrR family transcriptional regulator
MATITGRSANNSAGELTRRKILDAAANCFAEHGFAATSVRDITKSADCNIGAVTYYFHGKQGLYEAVFEQRFRELREQRVGALRVLLEESQLQLESVLNVFARAFLNPLIGDERGEETLSLIMRDMVDSHLPSGMAMDQMIRPTLAVLLEALEKTCPELSPESARNCCLSLVSQLVHTVQMDRLRIRNPEVGFAPLDIEETVAHIVRFSTAGIRACCGIPMA